MGRHMGLLVNKAALGQLFSEFPLPNNQSTNLSIIIITQVWDNRLIGGRSAEWTQFGSTPHYTN
jgi:hypothetical protein